ncbi:ParA family protein [Ectopseudomonas mendocina]|uniref:ParA family protein n=1 Tax=Ectopseudomonas mendocina TaxID=300 RepID=UPI000F7117FA|nr:ParA family protein [Pseudomonas mendocina]VEE16614.1 ATPase domain-containing protein [Pseudomonas mendocina]
MPLISSYAIWNNKGGVGKSTITFHLATRYAEQNPEKDVLVIDLCPQSNSSMILLGGGITGENNVLNLCSQTTPQTVVGYLSEVISRGSGAPLPQPSNFIVNVNTFNKSTPNNIFLLCGDGNLEPMAPAITGAAAAPALTPAVQPWKWVHTIFRELINNLASTSKKDLIVFIDTNPSFSIYTELAISAADRLITPVNADDSSRVATNAMFILLHGQTPPHPIYGSWTYAAQAQRHGMTIPQIHTIVGNRLTQYDGAATAFMALSDATADTLFSAYLTHPSYFTSRKTPASNIHDFRNQYSVALRDFNTAGVVAAHLGIPLSKLTQGYHAVHGTQVKVNAERVDECLSAIDDVITHIS